MQHEKVSEGSPKVHKVSSSMVPLTSLYWLSFPIEGHIAFFGAFYGCLLDRRHIDVDMSQVDRTLFWS